MLIKFGPVKILISEWKTVVSHIMAERVGKLFLIIVDARWAMHHSRNHYKT